MLDVTGRAEPASPYPAPPKERPYMEEIERSPGRLRIAWSGDSPFGTTVDPEILAALEATANLLADLGHEVVNTRIEADLMSIYAAASPLGGANFAAGMKRMIERVGREPEPQELEPFTWMLLHGSRQVSGADALYSAQERRSAVRPILQFFEAWDVFLSPVLGALPPPIGYLDPVVVSPEEAYRRSVEIFPFTWPFNFTGQPSISLPLQQSKSGLPIGMMFSARYADEATLFRLAAQLEKECPWAGRKPPIWN